MCFFNCRPAAKKVNVKTGKKVVYTRNVEVAFLGKGELKEETIMKILLFDIIAFGSK